MFAAATASLQASVVHGGRGRGRVGGAVGRAIGDQDHELGIVGREAAQVIGGEVDGRGGRRAASGHGVGRRHRAHDRRAGRGPDGDVELRRREAGACVKGVARALSREHGQAELCVRVLAVDDPADHPVEGVPAGLSAERVVAHAARAIDDQHDLRRDDGDRDALVAHGVAVVLDTNHAVVVAPAQSGEHQDCAG